MCLLSVATYGLQKLKKQRKSLISENRMTEKPLNMLFAISDFYVLTRWSDRLQSSSGERSGDVCDFYFRVYNKALREALANCLIHADYHGLRGIVIRKEADKLILANPGYIRTGKKPMRLGGESDPRNKALMKIFNLINIRERAGSGVPNIFNVWADEGWEEPIIEEKCDLDRTGLTLSFVKKQAIKTSNKKQAIKTQEKYEAILNAMQPDIWHKASEFENVVGVKESQIKDLFKNMTEQGMIVSTGNIKGRCIRKLIQINI